MPVSFGKLISTALASTITATARPLVPTGRSRSRAQLSATCGSGIGKRCSKCGGSKFGLYSSSIAIAATPIRKGGSVVKRRSAKFCRGGGSLPQAASEAARANTIGPASDRRIDRLRSGKNATRLGFLLGKFMAPRFASWRSARRDRRHGVAPEAVARAAELAGHGHGPVGLAEALALRQR